MRGRDAFIGVLLMLAVLPCAGAPTQPGAAAPRSQDAAAAASDSQGGAEAPQRRAVPHSGEQTRAFNAIREQYGPELSRPDAADRLALSREFRKQAAAAAGVDPVRQYVLLREARTLAVEAGNFDAAFAAINDMAAAFEVDGADLKTTAIAEALDRARIPPGELLNGYLKVTDDALASGDVQLAWQASRMAYRVAAKLRSPVQTEHVKQMDLRVHDARRELTKVIAQANTLKRNPDDPAANLAVGRYLCFVQGKWEQGIPLLAKGSEKQLADLARRDAAAPDEPNAMFDLAGSWWDLPDSAQTPRRRSHQRAAYWYKQALSRLSGQKKAIAEQHLAELTR